VRSDGPYTGIFDFDLVCLSVCLFVRLSVTLCILTLGVGVQG